MPIKPDFGNSQDLVEIEDIRENTVIMKNGSLRQILMVGGINFSLKSEEEQSSIIAAYQNFLNSLEFPIQIVIHSRKINIDNYLKVLDERLVRETSSLLQNQIAEYKEFIKSFVQENAIMSKTFLIVVPFVPVSVAAVKESLTSFLPFLPKKKESKEKKELDEKEKEEKFQKDLAQLEQRVGQIMENLNAIGLDAVLLNKEQLTELYYNFYNPESIERKQITGN